MIDTQRHLFPPSNNDSYQISCKHLFAAFAAARSTAARSTAGFTAAAGAAPVTVVLRLLAVSNPRKGAVLALLTSLPSRTTSLLPRGLLTSPDGLLLLGSLLTRATGGPSARLDIPLASL
jgi:hypothetical protein